MEKRQMYIADLNVVFGKESEPMIKRIDDIMLPAMTSRLYRQVGKDNRTRLFFHNVCINEVEKDEYVLQGLLIKDTVLSVQSVYDNATGLQMTNERIKS